MKTTCVIIMVLLATVANAYEIVKTVTEVIDGDTFKIIYRGEPITVRIADIDCPELQQPGGQEAKRLTSESILGKRIAIKTSGHKKNGIVSGRITTTHGHDMALVLIQEGLAWPTPKTKNKLVLSEHKKARNNRAGIWANGSPEPPWKYYRRTHIPVARKSPRKKYSLYGDSALDIARDPDGSAIGDGGGMTIAVHPTTYNQTPTRTRTVSIWSGKNTGTATSKHRVSGLSGANTGDKKIRENCRKKWKNDYEMIKYCVEQQASAKNSIGDIRSTPTIKSDCRKKWKNDYEMIEYCIKQQTDAKHALKHSRASLMVQRNCEHKWGTDYEMVKYCIEQQEAAKRSLGY